MDAVVAEAESVGRQRGLSVTLEELRGWLGEHPHGLTPSALCLTVFQDLEPLARFVAVCVALVEAHPRWVDRTASGKFRMRKVAARLPAQWDGSRAELLALEREEHLFADKIGRGELPTAPGQRGAILRGCLADITQYALALPNEFFEPVLARKCSLVTRKGMHQEEMVGVLAKCGALPRVLYPQAGAVEVLYHGKASVAAAAAASIPAVQDINELRVLNRWGLPFLARPAAAAATAAARPGRPPIDDAGGREVFRGLALAIDSPETTDVDDAVSCESLPGGALRVHVHVADVASRVAARADLGAPGIVGGPEARRATSVYLPSRVFHMCDDAVSLSLSEGWDSPAFTTSFEVSEAGEISKVAFAPTLLPRVVRVTYDQVDAMLLGGAGASHYEGQVALLAEASARLGRAREATGAHPIHLPKVLVKTKRCPRTGLLLPVLAREVQTPANKLVEHLMVAANMAAGTSFLDRGLEGLFRAQVGPASPVQALDASAPIHARLNAMRLMTPAKITSTPPLGHHSLGVPAYMQTTSPIRRLGDLVSQALMRDGLSARDSRLAREARAALPHLVEQCNEGQIWANAVQLRANRFWINEWVRHNTHPGPFTATITQVFPPTSAADRRISCWVDEIAQECTVSVPPPMWTGNAYPGASLKVHLIPPKKPTDKAIKATPAEKI